MFVIDYLCGRKYIISVQDISLNIREAPKTSWDIKLLETSRYCISVRLREYGKSPRIFLGGGSAK